jgi:hypothetical protein
VPTQDELIHLVKFGHIHQRYQPRDARARVSFKLRRGKGTAGKSHPHETEEMDLARWNKE